MASSDMGCGPTTWPRSRWWPSCAECSVRTSPICRESERVADAELEQRGGGRPGVYAKLHRPDHRAASDRKSRTEHARPDGVTQRGADIAEIGAGADEDVRHRLPLQRGSGRRDREAAPLLQAQSRKRDLRFGEHHRRREATQEEAILERNGAVG